MYSVQKKLNCLAIEKLLPLDKKKKITAKLVIHLNVLKRRNTIPLSPHQVFK